MIKKRKHKKSFYWFLEINLKKKKKDAINIFMSDFVLQNFKYLQKRKETIKTDVQILHSNKKNEINHKILQNFEECDCCLTLLL